MDTSFLHLPVYFYIKVKKKGRVARPAKLLKVLINERASTTKNGFWKNLKEHYVQRNQFEYRFWMCMSESTKFLRKIV